MVEVQGLLTHADTSGWRSIAIWSGVSTAKPLTKPGEAAFPDLEERALERLAGQVDPAGGLAVQPHAALLDETARL